MNEKEKQELQKLMRRRWSANGADYYKELENFHKTHEKADSIVYDSDFNCPVKAVYIFKPYQVVLEHLDLVEKLREISVKEAKQNES